ncbi:MAG: TonB-dependent receptor [Bacteroidota bacterium]
MFHLLWSWDTYAQNAGKVSGSIIDSTQNAIVDANILLISGKDTLRSTSDKYGEFSFRRLKAANFQVKVTMMGYKAYTGNFSLEKGERHLQLAPIILENSGQMLKEVVIHGKINPVRVLKDTLEFNAAAYQVLDGDKVSDLLKQLPGVLVDDDDNVTTMGKEMTKLRVNGKDFFTNDVKDFINKLPASIVAKIQIVDDYGDEANFTGLKIGEPQKMLNIVTKPGMNKGVFGGIGLNSGTNNQIGLNASISIWGEKEQIGSNFNTNKSDNGAGQSKSNSTAANYRRNIKNGAIGVAYNFNNNNSDNENNSFIETVNTLGTIYSVNENSGNNSGNNQNLNLSLQQNNQKNFLNANVSIGLSKNGGINNSITKQSGIIKQDLINESNSTYRSPNFNANLSWSKRLSKKGKNLSINFNIRNGQNEGEQNIISNTLYYNPISNTLAKDSLLNRLINTRSRNANLGGSVAYSIPLKQPKDSLANSNISIAYSFSLGNMNNNILTYVTDKLNNIRYVDSLSTQYRSLFLSQNISASYGYSNKKISYYLGASARPNTLTGDYQNLAVKIKNRTVNYAPNFNFSYRPSISKSISIRYTGSSNSPSANQLQPVRNTQNLQNIVIGNPNLKPSFNHSIGLSFNNNQPKSGRLLQLGITASTTQNQIVSNVVLLRDTLNSLRQETRYENSDGTYNLTGNYAYSIPLNKNKINISTRGNFSYNKNIIFTDNVKFFNKGLNFSQSISSNLNFKKAALSASVAYGINANNYTLIKGNSRAIETWNFSISSRATFFKSYKMSINIAKRINSGYALANTNPLMMNAALNKSFLKSKSLSLNMQAYDLLNQGNNLSRFVSGNSTIDNRTNQITRYFTFGLNYNLQKFGERKRN